LGLQLAKVIPDSTDIIVYNDNSGSLSIKKVTFNMLLGINKFLQSCSWTNSNGKLYISGGRVGNNESSNSFLSYDCSSEQLTRLPDMNVGRSSHSMIYNSDFIYVVGGFLNNSVEKFDLKGQKWVKLTNMNIDERQRPILYVWNGFLYAFFGMKSGNYIDTVERLNTKNQKSKWEIVSFKNAERIDLKMIGCGIISASEKEIYFFGGKGKDGNKSDAFKFDFSTNTFSNTPIKLGEATCFPESTLIDLGKNSYGQFHLENNENFWKIELK
jgi:hypothetical protein